MDTDSDTRGLASPDEIRARIRSEHAQISALLARVEALTERVGDGDTKSVIALRDAGFDERARQADVRRVASVKYSDRFNRDHSRLRRRCAGCE